MKYLFSAIFMFLTWSVGVGQTTGNGGSIPWIVLDSKYNTSPFNDTTEVDVWFDGSSYNGVVTSVQFKIAYDGVTFDSLFTIKSNLPSTYALSYNENKVANEVLISIVYTGGTPVPNIPDQSIVTLKFDHIPVKLLYSNEQNITNLTFGGYTAGGSNANGTDIAVGTYSHGGAIKIPHRKFSGYILDYGTGKGIPNVEYQLYRNNSLITTVLSGQPTVTTSTGYYEMVYYEHFYGDIISTTDFDFLIKTESINSHSAISTADAYKVLLYANGKTGLNPYQKLAADVNHSHTLSIADSYVLYGYNSGVYSGWSTLGAGGYRDVMIIKPEDKKYLEGDSLTVTGIGRGPLGFSPQETNWTYDLNAYNGIADLTENFYVVIMGDVNLTSLGGTVPSPAKSAMDEIEFTPINTSILAKLPNQNVATGDQFDVDLVIDTDGIDVHSFNFELEYDPEVLEFVEATTPYLPNAWMLYFNTDSTGLISYGGMDGSYGDFPIRTDTTETIIRFKFLAKSVTGIGETPIEFGDKYNTGDRNGDDLNTVVLDGKVYLHVVTSSIDREDFPRGFALEQNYPNPFNPTTNISFVITNPQVVSIDVFDLTGKLVDNVFSGPLHTGRHVKTFNAENIPSGVYIYRLTTENGSSIKQMTLIK